MPNIRDVADIAGVSVATVSRVLSATTDGPPVRNETAERVRQAARRLNYRGNYHVAAMRRGRADVMGFALHYPDARSRDDAGRWYFNELRDGIESTLQKKGVSLMGVLPLGDETSLQRGAKLVNKRQLDALIVPGHMAHFRETDELLSTAAGLPIVVVDNIQDVQRPCVRFDPIPGMRDALKHLLDLGHRKLLWVGPRDTRPTSRESTLYALAFELGLTGSTCRIDMPLGAPAGVSEIYNLVEAAVTDLLRQSGREWTALLAYSDLFAIGAVRAVQRAGLRMPQDISIVGFDDHDITHGCPSLTTIDHRLFEMGQIAGELALRLFESDTEVRQAMQNEQITLAGRLIVRDSTCRA